MPTYNGETNLIDQLDSIKNQSYPISEVIIADDGSTDQTIELIKKYITDNQLSQWIIKQNINNLGWRMNFFNALNAATSDIIFLSDQDDIWYNDKIESMVNFFEEHPGANALVSDYDELVEPGGVSYPVTKRKINHVASDGRIEFTSKNLYLNRPGWVYGLRQSFMIEINLFKKNAITPVHDIAIWSTAVLTDSLYYLNQRTGKWRKHGESAIREENQQDLSRSKLNIRIGKLNRLQEITISDLRYLKATTIPVNEQEHKEKVLNQLINEYEIRKKIMLSGKIINILKHIGSYVRVHDFFADLYFLLKN